MPSISLDARRRADGSPLRRSEESIPLQVNKNTDPINHDYVYEAQLSVLVTGIDDWVWAAYCFADVYFKGEEHTETVEHYSKQQIVLDPHSCGRYPANPPVWIPREYYLRALSCRVEQVKQEWSNSVSQLIQQTEPYVWTLSILQIVVSQSVADWGTFEDSGGQDVPPYRRSFF
jgi:hypothetical protein